MQSHLQLDLVLFMDMRALAVGLARRVRAFARHRAAALALRSRYPDALPHQLAAEPCAICRDSMQVRPRVKSSPASLQGGRITSDAQAMDPSLKARRFWPPN